MTGKNLFVVAAVWGLALQAASSGPLKLSGACDRPSCLYACGETATVLVTACDASGPVREGRLTLLVDDFGTNVVRTVEADFAVENPVRVKISRKTPGFLRVVAKRPGRADWCWGVGFDPQRIVKGSPSPRDFDAFWSRARARLDREVPPDLRLERVAERSPSGFDFYRISLATFGRRVYGYLSVPTDKSKGPFRTEVSVAAAGFGDWTNDMGGSSNSVSLFFSVYPFEPDWRWKELKLERRYAEFEKTCRERYGTGYPTAGLAVSREEYFYYAAILGIARAVDWLSAQPYVDGRHFVYRGTSQGGGVGLALCALTGKFSAAALYVPALTDIMGYRAGRVSGWPRAVEAQRPESRAAAARHAPYFDGANFAARITCPVRVAAGLCDTTSPPSAVYATYNALKSKDRQIGAFPGMGHNVENRVHAWLAPWLRER